jgi:hypothetical protein
MHRHCGRRRRRVRSRQGVRQQQPDAAGRGGRTHNRHDRERDQQRDAGRRRLAAADRQLRRGRLPKATAAAPRAGAVSQTLSSSSAAILALPGFGECVDVVRYGVSQSPAVGRHPILSAAMNRRRIVPAGAAGSASISHRGCICVSLAIAVSSSVRLACDKRDAHVTHSSSTSPSAGARGELRSAGEAICGARSVRRGGLVPAFRGPDGARSSRLNAPG